MTKREEGNAQVAASISISISRCHSLNVSGAMPSRCFVTRNFSVRSGAAALSTKAEVNAIQLGMQG